MSSAIAASSLGAFQAALSVLLTLGYGVFAARYGIINSGTAKDVSQLCVKMFLPALLITNVGKQIDRENITNYVPIFVWSLVYHVMSLAIGKTAEKTLGLPSWVAAACTFNNSTSLPLLLTKSLTATGILGSIAGGDVEKAVERAQSYFLLNSMVSNAATFAVGPKLFDVEKDREEDGDEEDESDEEDDQEEEADENTSLLPKPITTRISSVESSAENQFHRLPHPVQSVLSYVGSLVNPTLCGAIISIIVGLTPPLQKALFAPTQEGGWLNAWFTSSLKNIGELFTSLQMFVVGTKLSDSLTSKKSANPPKKALAVIFMVRFVFWALVSIPTIYMLAVKTNLLGDDPMLWWAMMLQPIGPPAMILSSLVEVAGVGQTAKMKVARTLTYAYIITPIIFAAVVGALKACEAVLDKRGQ
ncbi:membrane transport protein-domain-containing protein [Pyronema domesticum]|uniref:Uncharacterized protein n=1 Tax=Pyronema omphalodes (strain CBS 100304) TaxID=1076935 RepID=U4LWP1_PYROM|nr:membrane transport protein-domain-containing protein [Pyronema domesticum]CCX33948.1 Similar to hypothetical protein [Tuber melanosporum Mel28]; acc. no. XP_002836259 [Pyronema omphalodes CBS 100304]